MMTAIKKIHSSAKLKDRFFSEIEILSKSERSLYHLLYHAIQFTNVYVVGGFLRSIANNFPPRDLDIIINGDNEYIESLFAQFNLHFTKNKFGGYKVMLDKFSVDIWSVETNWAFKENLIKNYQNDIINKIAEGTFLNYDSLVFDLRSLHSNFKNYNKCVSENNLDILRKGASYRLKNPGRIGNIIRLFYIRQQTNLNFSLQLCNYILDQLKHLGYVKEEDMANYLYSECIKSHRFTSVADSEIIRQHLTYVKSEIERNYEVGSQIKLF